LLVEQGEGHVVNTASVAGLLSPPGFGSYSASKHAVVTISEILYRDLRLAGSTVGVSVLCPGYVRTRIREEDRNRPVWAPAPPTEPFAKQMRAITVQAVAEGIDPATVASHLLDAVRTNRFYILTHPEFINNVAIALRTQVILEGRVPTELTPAQVQGIAARDVFRCFSSQRARILRSRPVRGSRAQSIPAQMPSPVSRGSRTRLWINKIQVTCPRLDPGSKPGSSARSSQTGRLRENLRGPNQRGSRRTTGLTRTLELVRAGDVLVIWKLDRLGRSVKDLVHLVGELA
jgi:hypothetical protein